MSELLRMEHISKRFGNFYANQDINFSVAKGEVHTLLGENGAGKSTLMNILIGLYQPTEGKIFLNGQEVRIESPSQAVKLGIGMVHQHFMLVEAMTVFDNIILGDKHAKGLFIDRAARRKEIEALSEKYGLDVQLDKLITEISVGEQQRTEILKALYHGAELLILDEPSAALTDIEVEGLFAIMQKLVGEGKSIIFISHKMREVLRISDRITILRLGKVVGTVDRAETDGQNTDTNTGDLEKIVFTEDVRGYHWAPAYLAQTLGYFKEEGLDAEFQTIKGGDATAPVLSGDAQFCLKGVETSLTSVLYWLVAPMS